MESRSVNGPISQEELDALPAKTKKHPEVIDLYRKFDFLTAYAKHTDHRVVTDGYRSAIGAEKDWERHGDLQRDFLISQGLTPRNTLLEIGCGTGRLARKIAPYLGMTNYVGVDISEGAVRSANALSEEEGWAAKMPTISTLWPVRRVDYIWAFSVTIHLPQEILFELMHRASAVMHLASRFYFSYVPELRDHRTGLKQFRHTLSTYESAAKSAGLTFNRVTEWTGEQKIALATKQ
jgi:SAM-dependent methyltransferase